MKKYKENFELFVLIIIAAIVVYFIPYPLNNIIFLLVLPLAWKSKRDYFWIAFFFIINDQPGGLFSGGERTDLYRLPLYHITGKISFSISELFYLLVFIKSIVKEKEIGAFINIFKNEFKLLLILFIALVVISIPIGVSTTSLRNIYKISLVIILFYSFIRVINTWDKLLNFLNLIFPFALIAIALQLYGLVNKHQLIALFKPGTLITQGIFFKNQEMGIERPIELEQVLFVCFTGSLLLLNYKKHNFNEFYLIIVNIFSYLSTIMNATRSWFIAYTLGYIIFILFNIRKSNQLIKFTSLTILVGLIAVRSSPLLLNQIENAWTRLSTVKAFLSGDITAEGTLKRFDIRGPAVISAFKNSTILFGSAFSDHFFDHQDGHVGFHNILFNVGIIGSMIFIFVVIKILSYPFVNKSYNLDKTIIIPGILLLIVNSGIQVIGFTIEASRMILDAYVLSIINLLIINKKENCRI